MAHDEAAARAILAALGLGSAALTPLGRGFASDAWLVQGSSGSAVLRVAVDTEDQVTYPSEHAVMRRLRVAGAAVPEPITGSWHVDDWAGPAFSLTTFVPGTTLQPVAHAWMHEPIAAFLRTLHALEIGGVGPVVTRDGQLEGAFADPELGTIDAWSGAPLWPLGRSILADHPALGSRPELVARMKPFAAAIRAVILSPPFVLVHADLHEENILQDEESLTFIDFGVAFVGAPTWDIAALAYFLGWDVADRVLAAYLDPSADDVQWRRAVALTALALGARRWQQDVENGLVEDTHNETYLVEALDRAGS